MQKDVAALLFGGVHSWLGRAGEDFEQFWVGWIVVGQRENLEKGKMIVG